MENTFEAGGPGGGDIREKVNLPAILLLVAGGIGIAYALFSLVTNLTGGQAQQEQMNQMLSQAQIPEGFKSVLGQSSKLGLILPLILMAANGFIIYGGLQMKNLQSYGLAMAAAIVALIPCCPCGCIGIPVGIYALVILSKPEVKAAFRPS